MTKQNKWQKELGRIKNSKQALSFLTNIGGEKKEVKYAKQNPLSPLQPLLRSHPVQQC